MVNPQPGWDLFNAASFLLRIVEPPNPLLYLASREYELPELAERIWNNDLPAPYTSLTVFPHRNYHALLENDKLLSDSDEFHLITSSSPYWPVWKFHQFHNYFHNNFHQEIITAKKLLAKPVIEPIALWVRGKSSALALLHDRAVSVIGTRSPSSYGKRMTELFATTIAQHEISIISGGAIGIDAIAHSCAINAGSPSIAVLAGGVDEPTPKSNREIFMNLLTNGLLVSEYPPGTPPEKHRFLKRNRIIAALGEVLLITEAPFRSGALNTAWWADQLHVPIATIPGPLGITTNRGNLELLRNPLVTLCLEPEHCLELIPNNDCGRQRTPLEYTLFDS